MKERTVRSVLLVCTGNVCRSPMAEGILKGLLDLNRRSDVRVSSAGTSGLEGEPAAPLAVAMARARGIDISQHRARRLTGEMIEDADLVAVMEFEHLIRIIDLYPEAERKVRMLTDYGRLDTTVPLSIPDPYGQPLRDYETCFATLEGHVRALYETLT